MLPVHDCEMNRILKIVGACALLASTSCGPSFASGKVTALQRAALETSYADRCKSLKVDWVVYAEMLEKASGDVDKLDEKEQVLAHAARMTTAEAMLKPIDDKKICELAVADFGPRGRLAPGILSDGVGVKLQNKLFDWLSK